MATWTNLSAIGAGLLALFSFFFLPWLVVTTPVIEVARADISALTLATWGAFFTGGCLGTIWLVPVSGILLVLLSAFAANSTGSGRRSLGIAQLVIVTGLILPTLVSWVLYSNYTATLADFILLPDPLSPGSFFVPGQGFYLSLFASMVGLAASIINIKGP